MNQPSRDQYLESKVLTASQPKLHLMLLDGALRFGNQARDAWAKADESPEAEQSLMRMFEIVEELLQGLASGEGDIASELAEQYAFVYRELADCLTSRDRKKLDSCLQLLDYQRETWRLANERLDGSHAEADTKAKPAMPHLDMGMPQTSPGFSLEA